MREEAKVWEERGGGECDFGKMGVCLHPVCKGENVRVGAAPRGLEGRGAFKRVPRREEEGVTVRGPQLMFDRDERRSWEGLGRRTAEWPRSEGRRARGGGSRGGLFIVKSLCAQWGRRIRARALHRACAVPVLRLCGALRGPVVRR
jgi:hypothetical protein